MHNLYSFIRKRSYKSGGRITKNISYRLQFIDTTIFMASSISNLVNNLSEGIHKIKCKYRHNEKYETCGIKYKHCHYLLEYIDFKDDLIEYKCLCCNKNCQQKFDEKLKEQVKFILLLQKGVYPYEFLDDWYKFNETSLPGKEDLYNHLNMEDITDANYARAKRVYKNL